jgi:hypothetical protein
MKTYFVGSTSGVEAFIEVTGFRGWFPVLTILVFRPKHGGTEW